MSIFNMDNVSTAVDYLNTGVDCGLANSLLAKLDAKAIDFERSKIAESVKSLYSTQISKVLSAKAHINVMVNANSAQRLELNQNAKGGQDLLAKTGKIYEEGHNSLAYRAKRKMLDKFRAKVVKDISSHITAPLSFIPDGGISKLAASTAISLAAQGQSIRHDRKLENYTKNKAAVAGLIGNEEAQRKAAKWSSKTLGDVGSDLQRNLFKLKQSTRILQTRESDVNSAINRLVSVSSTTASSMSIDQVRKNLTDLALSFHEAQHYVDKITTMCLMLDTASNEIKAHMDNMRVLLESTENTIVAQATVYFPE